MANLHDRNPGPDDLSIDRSVLDLLLDRVSEVVVSCQSDGTIVYISPGVRLLAGYDAADVVGRNMLDFLHPDEHAEAIENLARWRGRTGEPRGQVHRLRASDGSWVMIDYDSVIDEAALGALGTMVITIRPAEAPAQDRMLVQRLLNEDRLVRLATIFVEHGPEEFEEGVGAAVRELSALEWVTRISVWRASSNGRDAERHSGWEAPSGAPRVALPDRFGEAFPHLRTRVVGLEEVHIRSVAHLPDDWREERDWFGAAGVHSVLAIPMVTAERFRGFVLAEVTFEGLEFDVTHLATLRSASAILAGAFERHAVEQAMLYEARHDPLTGLANRWALEERLASLLRGLEDGTGRPAGLALVNLDHFAAVNEALGRDAGDQLLRLVAARLVAAQATSPWLARVHGDEFAALWDGVTAPEELRSAVDALLAVLDAPFDVDGRMVSVTASTGVTVVDELSAGTAADVLRRVDVACRRSRSVGGAWVEMHEGDGEDLAIRHMQQASELRSAIDTPEIEVYYQGEWDMLHGRLVGAEALVRWNHPSMGLLSAASFIDLAESTGVIDRLGAQVLRTACECAVHWPTIAGADPVVRVNLSPNQLLRQDVVAMVRDVLDETALPPHRLSLELTENALLVDPDRAVAVLHKLRDLGVGLSIDDFGTGYSSLLYLKRLPVTSLKIDKAFIDGIQHDDDDRAIVEVVMRLADTFGLPVTAEGVEYEGQAEALRNFGCVLAQGYLFSRPEPEADFLARIRAG